MTKFSRTTLRELKKRYLNVLKKCLLANLGIILLSAPSIAEEIVFDEVYDNAVGEWEGGVMKIKSDTEFSSVKFINNKVYSIGTAKGGAIYNAGSYKLNFKEMAWFEKNTAEGNGTYLGAQGGAILLSNGDNIFNEAKFIDNSAISPEGYAEGGAIWLDSGSMSFADVDFIGNYVSSGKNASNGGAFHSKGIVNFNGSAKFINNSAKEGHAVMGGAIYNTGTMNFNKSNSNEQVVKFVGNESISSIYRTLGGAVYNNANGNMNFLSHVSFGEYQNQEKITSDGQIITQSVAVGNKVYLKGDNVLNAAASAFGGAISNTGTINFTSADFIGNKAIADNSRAGAGAIYNEGSITFTDLAVFRDNYISGTSGNGGFSGRAAIDNLKSITFQNAVFVNNMASSVLDEQENPLSGISGGILRTQQEISFNNTLFKNNTVLGSEVQGGIILSLYSEGTFKGATTFFNNTILSTGKISGGILRDGTTPSSLTFHNDTVFDGNIIKGSNIKGSLIDMDYPTINFNGFTAFLNNQITATQSHDGLISNYGGILNFSGGFLFANNTLWNVNSEGKVTRATNLKDIYIQSKLNISGDKDSFIENGVLGKNSTITKSGSGHLVFGDNSVSSVPTITFSQTEGTTISKNNNFLNGTNLINGGTLSVHGGVPTFTATLGNVIDDEGNKTASGTFELQSNVNEGLNISAVTDKIKVAEDATGTKIILGAYRDVEKTAHENLIKDKTVKITNEDGTVTERSLETLEYVDENGEKQEYDVVAGLFNTTTLGTANAKYHLDKDVGTEGNTISFENSDITFALTEYKNGTYELTKSTVVNLQNESIEEQSVTFADLDGSGATLSIDIALLKDSEGKTQLTADRLNLTSDGEGYKFAGVSFDTPMDGQALLDEILSGLMVGQDGTITPSIKHTVQVLGGNASFMGRKEATLSTASPYVYEVATKGQDLTVSADVLKGSALEYLNDTDTDVTLQIAEKGSTDYTVTEDLSSMGVGKKQILGFSNVATDSVINAGGKDLFTLDKAETELQMKDLTITEAGAVIDNQKGKVTLENVVIKESVNETALANGAELTLKDVSVDKGVVNSGKLTMSGNNALSTLTNNGETMVEGGKLSVTTLGGNGTLTMNGAELDSTNIATNNTIVSNGMSLSNGLTTFEVKSLEVKEGTTLDLNLAMTTADKIKNEGDMIANKNLSVGALEGTGTLTVNNATLNVADKFKTTNKIVSNGMKIGDKVTSEIHFADLEIKDNTTLDIKTLQATANTVTVGENATLGITLKNLDEYGTMKATEIIAKEDSKVHLTLGDNFAGGVFDVFKGTKGSGDLELVHNNVYHVVEVSEGKYSFMAKDTEALQESLGTTDNETVIVNALTQGTTSHAVFSRMQSEMLVALQSSESKTVEKAKKALKAVSSKENPVEQSITSEHLTALQNVVQSEIHATAIGRSGGEEEARAKVYIKGLYDRTKSSQGEGFRARSKGAVLGIQSQITDDLTLGLGYAFSNTIAKEDLHRIDVDTNTGFLTAHYQPNAWWLTGLATYSRGNYDEQKEILSSTGTANYNVDSWGAQVITGYDIKLDKAIITPEVGLKYLSLKQEAYTDSLGTKVSGSTNNYLTAMIGVKGMWDLGSIRPTVGLSIGYDIISDDTSATNTLANGASYVVNGESLDKLSTTFSTGIEADLSKRTSLKLEYSGTFRKKYQDHSGMLKVEVNF